MKKKLFFTGCILSIASAQAAYVGNCDEENFGISSVVAASEKTYYDGKVATYSLDREEPASAPAGIAINLPIKGVEGEPDFIACKVVAGLGSVAWASKKSSYDEKKGVLVEVPATQYNPDTSEFDSVKLKIRINLDAGTVTLE